jgi:UDPglucose 6-dehydrogenase
MILIGESDERSGGILEEFYTGFCESNPHIRRMNFVNAELTKLSVNTFVTTKISYANMLAQVCETLPGADVDTVTSAIGCDSRIGQRYLRGAMGYGGPCFPRDNIAFSALARANGVPALLAEATDQLNRRQVPRLAELILSHMPEGGVAGLLGLSYKPNTEVIEESQGVAIAKHLLRAGARVAVYDPAAMANARPHLVGNVTFAEVAVECARQADVLAITTPWAEFRNLRATDLKPESTLLDFWKMFSKDELGPGITHIRLGFGLPGAIQRDQPMEPALSAVTDED